jgi:starch-binding outer membrane protein, SusD/RagB family
MRHRNTMKTIKAFATLIVLYLFVMTACDDPLQPETFSTLGPTNFFNTADDAETALNGVYAQSQAFRDLARDALTFGEKTTDILISREGAIQAFTRPIEEFEFPTSHVWLRILWERWYSAIYRANVVLDNVPAIEMNEDRKEQILAEARFLRAFNYFRLYDYFGAVPIIETSQTAGTDRPERPTREEFLQFLENELRAVSGILPPVPLNHGRASQGAALGFLTKFHLNNRKWQEAADTAQELIDSGAHSLFTEGNRTELFALNNQRHSEFIFVAPFPDNPTSDLGNTYLSHVAPSGYQWQFPPKVIFAVNFKILSQFLESFEPEDERLDAFVFEYQHVNGSVVQLEEDDVRSFKYPEDPNGVGDVSGNDFPHLRYADILLSRAEALNELEGPNQESIDLINEIRDAAGVNPVGLGDFAGTEALREFILEERGREFHSEGLRRQDMIRHGVFIEQAVARGKNAREHHVLFPIPQAELDRNPNLEQNPGY